MRKTVLIIVSILLITLVAATFVACNPSENNGYTLELVDDKDYFEFTLGEIDWSSIDFYVYDGENNLIGSVTATESMVYGDDLQKLTTAGTKTITINYQGASLQVTFKLNNPVVLPTYTIVFNAGEGTFNSNGIPTEGSNLKTITANSLSAIPTPVREGYEFLGWYEDKQGSGTKLITPYELKRDLVVYAKWSDERKFDVTYLRYQDNTSYGVIGTVENIEYGTTIDLLSAEARLGFDFVCYEIWNTDETYSSETSTKINFESGRDTYNWTITSNITVKLQYNTKMLTLTYISDAWSEGQVVNGITIVGGVYTTKVAYGSELTKDIAPVPVLPEKVGYSGVWIDNSTSKEPVYSVATTDIQVRASYTINQCSMYFYDENDVLIVNATRTVDYNSTIDNEPVVPAKTGYDGVWMVYNEDRQLVTVSLKSIKMTEDVDVYARYTPKSYEINFYYRLEGMSENSVETFTYSYGDVILAPIDLSKDKEVGGVTYSGYNSKYYEILWYTSSSLSKQVIFPVDVVGSANYYYKVVARPYVVDFKLPATYDTGEIVFKSQEVKVGEKVIPPSAIMQGYEIVGWYYNAEAPLYDENAEYKANDYVYYNGAYYNAIQDSVGVIPTNSSYWIPGADRRLYPLEDYKDGIPVYDFHEYNSDNYYDRAFYAVIEIKQFSITFNNLVISSGDNGYEYNYIAIGTPVSIDYGTIGIASYEPKDITTPSYPDGANGKFVFEGWYLEKEFITLPVNLATYEVKDAVNLYAKWSDELVGTEGLVYTPYTTNSDGEVESYQVSAFNSPLAEYSHLTLRIPEQYQGIPVVAIADNAIANFSKVLFIDEVIISKNIAYIGDNAFAGCYNLEKFDVSASTVLVTDAYGVLYSADKSVLYSVALSNSSFKSLSTYTVPSMVKEIKGGAFAGAVNIAAIEFEGVSVENGILSGSANIVKIGSYAFDGCTMLKSIAIPGSVTEIGEYAFRGAYSLENIYIDAETSDLYKVGESAFDDCTDALTKDGDYLMIGNVLIKYLGDDESLTLSDNIVSIADGAFNRQMEDENASNYLISELTISADSSLKYIGSRVFLSCSSLSEIYILTAEKVEIEADSFGGVALSCKLYVNNAILNEYESDTDYDFFDEDSLIGV